MDLESQPIQPAPERNPEKSVEASSSEAQPGLERSVERPSFDAESTRVEQEPAVASGQGVVDPASLAVAQPPAPVLPADDSVASKTDDDLPLLASDDDLIEKEWVDKAKQVVDETKDDPSRQEKEVARLQSSYLKKRYGKDLGASEHD